MRGSVALLQAAAGGTDPATSSGPGRSSPGALAASRHGEGDLSPRRQASKGRRKGEGGEQRFPHLPAPRGRAAARTRS